MMRKVYCVSVGLIWLVGVLIGCLFAICVETMNVDTKESTESKTEVYVTYIEEVQEVQEVKNEIDTPVIEVTEVKEIEVVEAQPIVESDRYLLAKIVECEAGNQDLHTMELVASVILNRVKDDRFPSTIEGVIKQNTNGVYQFSPLASGGSWYSKEPSDNAYVAVDNVLTYESDISGGALFFETCASEDNWHSRNLEFLHKSGVMRFYK